MFAFFALLTSVFCQFRNTVVANAVMVCVLIAGLMTDRLYGLILFITVAAFLLSKMEGARYHSVDLTLKPGKYLAATALIVLALATMFLACVIALHGSMRDTVTILCIAQLLYGAFMIVASYGESLRNWKNEP
ncbi:hypothetical protein KKH24_00315 [Patescibacteria group bacterium]|nr:hypothetical protein [Patescibacteria group bacterium]